MRRLGLIGFLVLLLPACKPSTAPKNDLDAIQVSVRVEPNVVVSGTTATITLTLKNTALHSVEVSQCPIYFWVQGASGQIVGGSNLMYCIAGTLVYQPLRFAPLETKTLTFAWLAGEAQEVPPGNYDVFGWVNEPAHRSAAARITVQ